jgi:hypothetical protein
MEMRIFQEREKRAREANPKNNSNTVKYIFSSG